MKVRDIKMKKSHPNGSLCLIVLLLTAMSTPSCRPKSQISKTPVESISPKELKEPLWVSALPPALSFAGPHKGTYQETFMNSIAFSALQENNFDPWPEGSEFIKRTSGPTGEVISYSGQFKTNGWEWSTFDKDGKLVWRAGSLTPSSCNQCHQQMASKFDGVFTPVFFGKGSLSIPINK